MKKKGMYSYTLTDGRTALSPEPLVHALDDGKKILRLEDLTEDEIRRLSILSDPLLAHLLTVATDSEDWLPPEQVISMTNTERLETSFYRHCCVLKDGTIYVRAGKFVPLTSYITKASHEDLIYTLWNVALQASLAQLALAAQKPDDTKENTDV